MSEEDMDVCFHVVVTKFRLVQSPIYKESEFTKHILVK